MTRISQSVGWWCYVPGKLTAEEFIRALPALRARGDFTLSPVMHNLRSAK